jgi:hypothetical protein
MKRKEQIAKSVTQSNNASCIPNHRGNARRAKRHASKKLRQALDYEDRDQERQQAQQDHDELHDMEREHLEWHKKTPSQTILSPTRRTGVVSLGSSRSLSVQAPDRSYR